MVRHEGQGYAIDCPVRAARDLVPIAVGLEPVRPYEYYSYCYSYDAAEQYQDRYLGIGNPIDFRCSNEAATILTRHTVWITREGPSTNLGFIAEAIKIRVPGFNSLKGLGAKAFFKKVITIGITPGIIVGIAAQMARDTVV